VPPGGHEARTQNIRLHRPLAGNGRDSKLGQTFPGTGNQPGGAEISHRYLHRTQPVRQDYIILKSFRQAPRLGFLGHSEGQGPICSRPRGFFELHPPPVILDEVHYALDFLLKPKRLKMSDVKIRGFNFLTGSQNVILLAQVTKSLAGWAPILRLLPYPKEKPRDHPKSQFP
jgi:hypothetical protein